MRTCRKTYLGYELSLKEKEREAKRTVIISWGRKKSSRINVAAWAVAPEETAEFLGRESILSQERDNYSSHSLAWCKVNQPS